MEWHTHKYVGKKNIKIDSSYNLTEEMFDFYCDRVDYWIKIFNQQNWSISYSFEEDDEGYLAWVSFNTGGRAATFGLGKIWKFTEPTREEIDKSAYHEVLELLLSDLYSLVRSRNYLEHEIDMAGHNVIRILENNVYKNMLTGEDVKLFQQDFGNKKKRR